MNARVYRKNTKDVLDKMVASSWISPTRQTNSHKRKCA